MKVKIIVLALLMLTGAAAASDVRNMTLDGRQRVYRVYRPAGLDRTKPVPLVVMLHGAFGTGEQAERSYGWDAEADKAGFVVAYPDGIRRTWNAGGACCGPAHSENIDDVGFLDKLIDTLVHAENIDVKAVYVAGMSNGGAMTYRYACEGAFPIAAIGPVASSFTYSCNKPHALPVLAIHGLADKTVPYAGGLGRRGRNIVWLPVQASLDAFRDADVCRAPTLVEKGVVVTSTAKCDKGREVILITVADAGHQWPGSQREDGFFARFLHLDPPSTALEATPTLWVFFARHRAD